MAMRGVRHIPVHTSLNVKPPTTSASLHPLPLTRMVRKQVKSNKSRIKKKQANNRTSHNNEDSLFAGINNPKKIKRECKPRPRKY
jgi:hypothetical protein